jgi:hypothetical protein
MQIVAQTKRRSGWPAHRTLAALGVPRSVYYGWRRRESLQDRPGVPCRVYEVLPAERGAICEFALVHPKVGYRKLTWMMVDAGIACVGESTVYRVLDEADLLSRWKRSELAAALACIGAQGHIQYRSGGQTDHAEKPGERKAHSWSLAGRLRIVHLVLRRVGHRDASPVHQLHRPAAPAPAPAPTSACPCTEQPAALARAP